MKMNINKSLYASLLTAVVASPQFAIAAGGLADATTEANAIKVWLYGILGIFALGYIMWLVFLAMGQKKQWVDVLIGLGHVALAGGSLVAAAWAWAIWGT